MSDKKFWNLILGVGGLFLIVLDDNPLTAVGVVSLILAYDIETRGLK